MDRHVAVYRTSLTIRLIGQCARQTNEPLRVCACVNASIDAFDILICKRVCVFVCMCVRDRVYGSVCRCVGGCMCLCGCSRVFV